MINYHSKLVSALNSIGLPVHYEMTLTSKTKAPCITYMELSNVDDAVGDTLKYSRISYQIKIWSNSIKEIQEYALKIDEVMRPLGFERTGAVELYDNNSTMIQKVFTYSAIGYEY